MLSIASPPAAPPDLSALGERVRPVALAGSQRVPVLPPLEPLLPQGLARGIGESIYVRDPDDLLVEFRCYEG